MLQQEEFKFQLTKSLNYQDEMGDHNTDELLLKAPVGRHEAYVCKLQQGLMKSVMAAQALAQSNSKLEDKTIDNSEKADPSIEDTAYGFLSGLRAGSQDLMAFKKVFYSLLLDGICLIEGGTKQINITRTLLDKLSLNDKDKLLGEYLANFIQL